MPNHYYSYTFILALISQVLTCNAEQPTLDPASTATIKKVTLSCDHWPRFCSYDNKGLYLDIFKAVYEPINISTQHSSDPFLRGLNLVKNGQKDILAGAYKRPDREELFHYPKTRLSTEYIVALRLSNTPAIKNQPYKGKISYIRGYSYKKYLDNNTKAIEISRVEQGVKMIAAGKIDYFINPLLDTYEAISKLKKESPSLNTENLKIDFIEALPVYFLFTKNPRGKKLAELFDHRMKLL